MKRWCYRIALCLCACLLTLGLCGRMEAAEVVDSGSCGESLTWSLDGDGVLTIRGMGEMADYQAYSTPWENNNSRIKSVVVEPGVTSIGANAFYYAPHERDKNRGRCLFPLQCVDEHHAAGQCHVDRRTGLLRLQCVDERHAAG